MTLFVHVGVIWRCCGLAGFHSACHGLI